MTRSPLRCCTSIIWSSALVQASSSLSIGRTCAWPRRLPVTEMNFRHFSREFVTVSLFFLASSVREVWFPVSAVCFAVLIELMLRSHFQIFAEPPSSICLLSRSPQKESTHFQHLACRDRAICGCLFRDFRSKPSQSTDRHDPQCLSLNRESWVWVFGR